MFALLKNSVLQPVIFLNSRLHKYFNMIIESNYDINTLDIYGRSCIFYSTDITIIKYFINHGARTDIIDKENNSLFDYIKKSNKSSLKDKLTSIGKLLNVDKSLLEEQNEITIRVYGLDKSKLIKLLKQSDYVIDEE